MTTVLACPVCGAELALHPTAATCPRAHTFDRARSGYLNLLLSNKKQSAEATATAVAAAMAGRTDAHVADLGCGEGFFTARTRTALAAAIDPPPVCYGVDISRPGVKMAAGYGKDIHWVVASLHNSPFLPQSLDAVLSIFAPIDTADVRRIIRNDGTLVTVTPGPDHLDALRIIIYSSVKPHPQTPALMSGDTLFTHTTSTRVRYPIVLESPVQIMNLLAMTPYYWHISRATKAAIEELKRLELTVDAYVNVFRPLPR